MSVVKVIEDDEVRVVKVPEPSSAVIVAAGIIRETGGSGGDTVEPIEYTADGTEGNTVTITDLIGKTILLVLRDDVRMKSMEDYPDTPRKYAFNDETGTITFMNDLEPDSDLFILYK